MTSSTYTRTTSALSICTLWSGRRRHKHSVHLLQGFLEGAACRI
jgi:hypothetical protein